MGAGRLAAFGLFAFLLSFSSLHGEEEEEGGEGAAVPPGQSTAGLELARTRGIRLFN